MQTPQTPLKKENILPKIRLGAISFSTKTIYILSFLLSAFFAITSLFFTSYLQKDYVEVVHFKADSPLILIVLTLLLFISFYLLLRLKPWEKLPKHFCTIFLLAWVFILGAFWVVNVRSIPTADSEHITMAVTQFLLGDYTYLLPYLYMGKYPYQLGFAFYMQLVFTLTRTGDFLLLQLINVCFSVFAFHQLFSIGKKIFPKASTSFVLFLLLLGCLPVILYSTFIYGNTIGLALSLCAVNLALAYHKRPKIRFLVAIVLLCTVAVILKNNYLIFAIAIFIFLMIDFLRTLSIKTLLASILLLVFSILGIHPIYWYYQNVSGMPISSGVPLITTIAMGLQPSDMGPGWYSRLNENLYVDNGYDEALATAAARKEIKKSIISFLENPAQSVSFFYDKAVSQWNEPSFGSLWISHNINQHGKPLTPFIKNIYEGPLNVFVLNYMNFYHFIIMLGAFMCLFAMRKKVSLYNLLPMLIVLGGFIFHFVWEAKSQYIWPYFFLLIPYAANGISSILESSFIGGKLACKL